MNGYSIVIIDGTYSGDYYVADNQVQYITDTFGNSSSSSIVLYKDIGNTSSNYIRINSLGLAYYYSGSSYQSNVITDVTNVRFNAKGYFIRDYNYCVFCLLFIFAVYAVCRWFR